VVVATAVVVVQQWNDADTYL